MKRIVYLICLVITSLVYPTISATAQDRTYTFEFDMEEIKEPQHSISKTLAPIKVTLIDDKDKYKFNSAYSPCSHTNIEIKTEDPTYNVLLSATFMTRGLGEVCYYYPKQKCVVFPDCNDSSSYLFAINNGVVIFTKMEKDGKSRQAFFSSSKNDKNLKVITKLMDTAEASDFYGFISLIPDD